MNKNELPVTYEHPDPSENTTSKRKNPSFVPDGNSSFAFGSLSESEALAMILDPENHIANFKHNPNDSSDNLGDKKARTKEAHISGDFLKDGNHYKGRVVINGPGFIGRSLARVRGREPKMFAQYSRLDLPREELYEHRR
jgi:hypothetical protein